VAPAATTTKTFNAAEFDSDTLKPLIEAVLRTRKLTPAAQTFLAQTFARANQYDTVRLSPKQWEWMDKLIVGAGLVMPNASVPATPADAIPL
jgi:hypothetical protein